MPKKNAIMLAATKLLAIKGYNNTSMAEVAKSAGVAQGTIFYHFNSKEALFLSILKRFKRQLLEEFDVFINGNRFDTGIEMLESGVRFFLWLAGKKSDEFFLLYRHEAYELARINPDFHNLLESIYDCFIDFFEHAILSGQKDGSVGPLQTRKTALIIFTMVDGVLRLNLYRLYEAGTLYEDLILAIRRMVANHTSGRTEETDRGKILS